MIRAFLRDETAATAIEYGLIAAIVCIGMIVGLTALSSGLQTQFETISAAFPGS